VGLLLVLVEKRNIESLLLKRKIKKGKIKKPGGDVGGSDVLLNRCEQ
jgi:hypothetical protein